MSRRTKSLAAVAAATLMTSLLQPAGAATGWARRDTASLQQTMTARTLSRMPKVKTDPVVEPITENFEVVNHVKFRGASGEADVFLYKHQGRIGKHAYVGTWGPGCDSKGVKIVKVKRPRNAKLVARAAGRPDTSSEDMAVFRKGRRDILAVGIQPCGERGVGGLALYNVTKPSEPRLLKFMRVRPMGVHELDVAVRPDGRILVLASVPFAEIDPLFGGAPSGGDFRIIEVTRPRNPVVLSDWGAVEDGPLASFKLGGTIDSPLKGLGYFAAQMDHSARAADDGMTAYVSYWDAGILKFDISDPANPVLVGRTQFPASADGDAHSLALLETEGERYIYQNDEDFSPWSILTLTSTATANDSYQGLDFFWLPTPFTDGDPVTGEFFDAGAGCAATDYEGAAGKIVLADLIEPTFAEEPPACDPFQQLLLAAAADARALIFNWIAPADPFVMEPFDQEMFDQIVSAAPSMSVGVTADYEGFADALRARPGSAPALVTVTPEPPAWGYIRIFRESNPTDVNGDGVPEFEQVGEFNDLPHVVGESASTPPGGWSVHNTEIMGNRAYSSWYTHGFVALDLSDPTNPVKVGQFRHPSARRAAVFGPDAYPSTWGVWIDPDKGLIYASDMRSGLWILRPTGAAAATTP